MGNYKYSFTVYTPVFNGGKFIHRVYNSLVNQTYRNFEWLIINDGSDDDSDDIINAFVKKCEFPVKYINLIKNIGFNKSFNLGVSKAEGYFFLVAHCDDEFKENSLQIFDTIWNALSIQEKGKLQGVKCNCIDQQGDFIGDPFPESPWISDLFEITFKKKIKGEKWGTIKADILKEYPFPEEYKFVSESLIWFRIFHKYKAVFVNESLRIYYVNHDKNSLLSRTIAKNTIPESKRLLELEFINHFLSHLISSPTIIIKIFGRYIGYSVLAKIPLKKYLAEINTNPKKLICLFLLPLGYFYSKS